MSLLLETIRCRNGVLENLKYHEERLNKSREILFNSTDRLSIMSFLSHYEIPKQGLYKCRIIYEQQFFNVEFDQYQRKEISSIGIVYSDSIEYHHKFADRSKLQSLLEYSGKDEIIIVKNELITDTSYSNIVFVLGTADSCDANSLITPRAPLLQGTQRQKLLDEKKIILGDVGVKDLVNFRGMILINSMLAIGESPILPISIVQLY